jgi:hypothetical protein
VQPLSLVALACRWLRSQFALVAASTRRSSRGSGSLRAERLNAFTAIMRGEPWTSYVRPVAQTSRDLACGSLRDQRRRWVSSRCTLAGRAHCCETAGAERALESVIS